MKRTLIKGSMAALALSISATALVACATQQSMTENFEHTLIAAGFLEKPADTPRRQQRLAALQPYRILSQRVRAGGKDSVGYVYADPQFCRCVFVGGPEAYQRFEQLAFQARLAQEQIAASDMAYEDSFGWGDWGPYPYWGGGEVVVEGGGHFAGGGFHGGAHR